jgi:hypothetical protein
MTNEMPLFSSERERKHDVKPVFDVTQEQQTTVNSVVRYFEGKEQGGKPIPGKDIFIKRLESIAAGEKVPIVIFNCISFTYYPDQEGLYPAATPVVAGASSIVDFYRNDLAELVREVKKLGEPDVQVVVPDSEFDKRVLNIPLSDEKLRKMATELKRDLADRLQGLPVNVSLLTEYTHNYGLPSPSTYTEKNYSRIKESGSIKRKHVNAERQYFSRNAIVSGYLQGISDEAISERLMWYYGMYAGEGEALRDSGAIVLNLEDDSRVTTWLQRGASQNFKATTAASLPILTPVTTREFVEYKKIVSELKRYE